MADFHFEEIACPIVKVNEQQEGHAELQQVVGTAFCIGDTLFLTAKHCLFPENGKRPFALAYQVDCESEVTGEQPVEIEEFDIDVSLVKIQRPIPTIRAFPWKFEIESMLSDVWTAGFPHALSSKDFGVVSHRAFKGHIVTNTQFKADNFDRECRIYELSFPAPMGLSGAPLLRSAHRNPVIGLVFGNRATSLEIAKEIEVADYGATTEYHMYIQRYEYGTAITSREIGSLRSDMLGMTIEEHIRRQGLAI